MLAFMAIHLSFILSFFNLSLIWSYWKKKINSRAWNNKMQSEQAAGLQQRSRLEPKLWFLPSLIVSHTSYQLDFKFQQPH